MNYREIEKKYSLTGNLVEAELLIRRLLPIKSTSFGRGMDFYFKSPPRSSVDFIRIRENGDNDYEITVKSKDRVDNLNRLEINSKGQDRAAMLQMCRALFGNETARLDKRYTNFYLHDGSVITVYQVQGMDTAILEVEGISEQQVDRISKLLQTKIELQHEPRSLYEMLVKPNE